VPEMPCQEARASALGLCGLSQGLVHTIGQTNWTLRIVRRPTWSGLLFYELAFDELVLAAYALALRPRSSIG
jgi:hypothetical protein